MSSELRQDIIKYVYDLKKNQVDFVSSYGDVEVEDTKSDFYIDNIKQYVKQYGMPRPVSFWELDEHLVQRVRAWLHNTPYANSEWKVQYVRGNSSIAPHIDVRRIRTRNLVYVIQPGGPDVRTTWWTCTNPTIPETTAIPFDMLQPAHSQILQADRMYMIDVSSIHSVNKFPDDRIMLSSNVL